MKVLSLFDGISCGMVALERAGIDVDQYFSSEIDKNAIAISKKNHPNIIRLGDVTKWKDWNLPKIDLVIGGSPCQGFSRAGKCLNFDDPRSKLFFEYVDILNSIKEKNHDVKFLLENVKMKNEWKDVISEYLGVQPIEINSSLVSGQNRTRMYWTNINGIEHPEDKGIDLIDILEDVNDDGTFIETNGVMFDESISEASRNLVSNVNDEIRISQSVKCGYITAEDGDGINLSFPTSKSRRGRVIKQKSSTLDCACNICVLQCGAIRRFTTKELERLQTLPDGYTEGFRRTVAQKAIGNGWTVDVIAHILSYLKNEKENKNMELKIFSPTEDGFVKEITWNHEEIRQQVSEKVALYKNLVYTDDQIKDAKTDRATLNKFVSALEDKRKEIKKQCLAPYESFEKKMKEIIATVNEPINLIDSQIKGYEEKLKNDKLNEITEYWKSVQHPEELALEEIFDSRWLNASVSMKSILDTINSAIEKFNQDMATLANLPEYGFEAKQVYISSLDLSNALNEANRLSEMAKKKAEFEAEQARLKAEEIRNSQKAMMSFEEDRAKRDDEDSASSAKAAAVEPAKQWISFTANLTIDQAMELKAFFESRQIEFKAV